MLAGLLDRMGGVLRTVHAADVKLLPFEGIVVHPELRQVLKKLLTGRNRTWIVRPSGSR